MRSFEKSEESGSHDLWKVKEAAAFLQGQACTLAARHISDGMLRLRFNQEIAYFANRIIKDTKEEIKNTEEGLNAIKQEQQSLYERSTEHFIKGVGLVAGFSQMTAALMLCGKTSKIICRLTSSAMALHGVNNTLENTRNIMEDRMDAEGPLRFIYQESAILAGGTKSHGNIAYGTSDIGLSAYAALRMMPTPKGWRLWYDLNTDLIRGYKAASPTSLLIDAGGTGVNIRNIIQETNTKNE